MRASEKAMRCESFSGVTHSLCRSKIASFSFFSVSPSCVCVVLRLYRIIGAPHLQDF